MSNASAARIDALLPQTQCTRCGYTGCRPYAAAIAAGEAPINQCPPGGRATIEALADLLGREYLPLNPANGVESPPRVAWIDEERCIGCARCLPPCPVDAIVGALQVPAHRARRSLHGLRAVPGALPGRLHRDAARPRAGRRSACPQPRALRGPRASGCSGARGSGSEQLDAIKAAAPRAAAPS